MLTERLDVIVGRYIPPTKKHSPRHSSKLVRMDPKIAAWMTGMRFPCSDEPFPVWCLAMRITKRIISTIDPNAVSIKIPETFGIFLANSWPAKPSKLATGTIAM
jgi:hypothetical protein